MDIINRYTRPDLSQGVNPLMMLIAGWTVRDDGGYSNLTRTELESSVSPTISSTTQSGSITTSSSPIEEATKTDSTTSYTTKLDLGEPIQYTDISREELEKAGSQDPLINVKTLPKNEPLKQVGSSGGIGLGGRGGSGKAQPKPEKTYLPIVVAAIGVGVMIMKPFK